MATSEPDDTECSICHEPFTQPKLILCGHLVCRHCLISWLKSQQDAACPLCRDVIVEPKKRAGSSVERIVDDFPTDLSMVVKVEADRLLNRNQKCCVCEDVAATCLCLDCRDLLCSSCAKVHSKLSALRHHKVKTLVSLTADELEANPAPSPCSNHANKNCELHCVTHGVSMCHICATSRHKSCPEVIDLEEMTDKAREELAELTDKLSDGETQVDQAVKNLDQHLYDLEKKKQMNLAKIKEMCDRLDRAVNKLRSRIKELESSAHTDITAAAQDGKNCLLRRRGRLTSHKAVTQGCQGMKMNESVIEMSQKMKTRIKDLDLTSTFPAQAKAFSTVTLMIDSEAVSRVETMLANMGKVKIVSPQHSASSQDQSQTAGFCFHDMHGRNILLSNDRRTARQKLKDQVGGVVVCDQPMKHHMLYEVRLDEKEAVTGFTLLLGVITTHPDSLETFPDLIFTLDSAVIVLQNGVRHNGKKIASDVGRNLRDVPLGGRVGLMIDNNQALHLYVDGEGQGVAATGVREPCFFFVELQYVYKKITALPVTAVKKRA